MFDKYVGLPYCRAEMYAGRVTCCPLVSIATMGQTTIREKNGCQTITLCFPLDADSVTTMNLLLCAQPSINKLSTAESDETYIICHVSISTINKMCLQSVSCCTYVAIRFYWCRQATSQYRFL